MTSRIRDREDRGLACDKTRDKDTFDWNETIGSSCSCGLGGTVVTLLNPEARDTKQLAGRECTYCDGESAYVW